MHFIQKKENSLIVKYTIEYLQKAQFELADAVDWYNKQKTDLGIDFGSEVSKKLKALESYPARYPKIDKLHRQVSISRFPFCIVYLILEAEQKVIIISIFHHSRNPNKKFRS